MSVEVKLSSADGVEFTINKEAAEMSATIKDMISEIGTDATIPVASVKGRALVKVIEYATYHSAHPEAPVPEAERYRTDNISDWDKKFMDTEIEMLFLLVMAANYLDIKPLLDLGCKTLANMIKGHSPEEVKEKFRIPSTSEFYKPPAVAAAATAASAAAAAAVPVAVTSSSSDQHMTP
jgi:S-phase kinase-associated protein 1